MLLTCNGLQTRDGKTRPGESQSLTDWVRKIVWKCFVCPGVLETLTTWITQQNKVICIEPRIQALVSWTSLPLNSGIGESSARALEIQLLLSWVLGFGSLCPLKAALVTKWRLKIGSTPSLDRIKVGNLEFCSLWTEHWYNYMNAYYYYYYYYYLIHQSPTLLSHQLNSTS